MRVKAVSKDNSFKSYSYSLLIGCVILIFSGLLQVSVSAKIPIVIGSFQDDAQPIAVVPFTSTGAPSSFDYAALISTDLASTGEYAPMSRLSHCFHIKCLQLLVQHVQLLII